MARYSNVQTDFSGGLISDHILGRTDIKRVGNSGRVFKNFFPTLQGPAVFRSGFKRYNEVDVEQDKVKTVDLVLATTEPYRIVFSAGEIKIYDNNGVLKDTVSSPYSASEIDELRFSPETGELHIAHGRHRPKVLTADLTFLSVTLLASGGETLISADGRTLKSDAEIQGDDQWTLSDMNFDVEPFLENQPSSNKFSLIQNERFVKLTSLAETFEPIRNDFEDSTAAPAGQFSQNWYVEYNVDGTKFLGRVVSQYTDATNTTFTSVNYTIEDPSDDNKSVYIEPVVSVLDIEDNAAQLYLLDAEETSDPDERTALKLDGVPNDKIHLRSDTTIFNAGQVNSWIRVGDDRRNNNVVVGDLRDKVRWVKVKEHRGTEDHPVEFFRGIYDQSDYKAGSVYRIYGSMPSTLKMFGPDASGNITTLRAVLSSTGNRTYSFVNELKDNGGNAYATSNNLIGNLSTQKQFDVVECYNETDDSVKPVEEYDGSNGNLIVPPDSARIAVEIIANDALLNSTQDTFLTEDLGRHIMGIMESGNVYMKVSRTVSSRQVAVTLLNAVPRNKRTLTFENAGNFEDVRLGAWFENNFPVTVAKFEQRRIYGGTFSNPNFVYFSRVDNEFSFQPTQDDGEVLDTDAISYALANRNAGIRWMNAAKDLVIGTSGGIYRIVPNQYQYGISPKTIRMELTEEEPCDQQAETVASSIFYADQSGTRLMEYKYDQAITSSSSNDVSKLIYGVFIKDPIAQIAYQHAPQPRIWTRTVGGKLFCLSYHRQEEFYAWSEHDLGDDAHVLDISVIHKGSETNLDKVWIIVRRNLPGHTNPVVRTEGLSEPDIAQTSDYPMLDSYYQYNTTSSLLPNASAVFDNLGDSNIALIDNGEYKGLFTHTAASSYIATAAADRTIILGRRYTGELQMMFPTWDAQNKPAYGADTARIISLKAFFIKSFSFMLGIKDKFDTIELSTDYGANGGFTGFDKERPVAGSTFGVDNVPTIKHEEPYPLTIASLITKTDLN
ncbi:phage tail protein [Sneathiella sp.]|jgi:hypothetical protein|uniref:hypothetical protein n=1 Tax=Sneathiella sp. TaxID=1964365 RepID=UPI0025E5DEED|nr:hypothetical protein [Sneathiella sp.]|tara:strand:+ start:1388 stop:4402 length:3015 start_codon:yes stop_codon:yes gene_type:complete